MCMVRTRTCMIHTSRVQVLAKAITGLHQQQLQLNSGGKVMDEAARAGSLSLTLTLTLNPNEAARAGALSLP